MEMRALGKGQPKVCPLGIGAMSFSDFYGATDETASHAILEMAVEAGVRMARASLTIPANI